MSDQQTHAARWEEPRLGPLVRNGRGKALVRRDLNARRQAAERYMSAWLSEKMCATDECVLWDGGVSSRGYGKYSLHYTHRLAYELLVAPIPNGLTIDHLCRVKLCCNPRHLEAVTPEENHRRWRDGLTHCHQEHPFTPENTYVSKIGRRDCRICRRARRAARRAVGVPHDMA